MKKILSICVISTILMSCDTVKEHKSKDTVKEYKSKNEDIRTEYRENLSLIYKGMKHNSFTCKHWNRAINLMYLYYGDDIKNHSQAFFTNKKTRENYIITYDLMNGYSQQRTNIILKQRHKYYVQCNS